MQALHAQQSLSHLSTEPFQLTPLHIHACVAVQLHARLRSQSGTPAEEVHARTLRALAVMGLWRIRNTQVRSAELLLCGCKAGHALGHLILGLPSGRCGTVCMAACSVRHVSPHDACVLVV